MNLFLYLQNSKKLNFKTSEQTYGELQLIIIIASKRHHNIAEGPGHITKTNCNPSWEETTFEI